MPFIAEIKESHLNNPDTCGPLFCWDYLERDFLASISTLDCNDFSKPRCFILTAAGNLKSIYLSPAERREGLNSINTMSLPFYVRDCVHRFGPKQWINDEILNAYVNLCAEQEGVWIGTTNVYLYATAHFVENTHDLVSGGHSVFAFLRPNDSTLCCSCLCWTRLVLGFIRGLGHKGGRVG